MAISFGTAGAANVRDGDTISSHPPIAMSDLIKKSEDILDSSQQAIKNVTLGDRELKLGQRQDRPGSRDGRGADQR